jgi:predicted permease
MSFIGAFRTTLRLAPRDFQRTHGSQMIADFRDALASEPDVAQRTRYALRALLNLFFAIVLEERLTMVRRPFVHAFRSLARTPAFTAIVILMLALGIGSNVAAFSVVNGVLFHPLPYAQSDRMVAVWRAVSTPDFSCSQCPQSLFTAFELQTRNHTFDALAPYSPFAGVLALGGKRQTVRGAVVGTRFFDVVGEHPQLGRAFTPDDEKATAVSTAVITHALFLSALHGDIGLLGSTMQLDGQPVRIIGVVSDSLLFPNFTFGVDEKPAIYVSIQQQAGLNPNDHGFGIVGRLASGVSPAAGQADLNRIIAGLAKTYPSGYIYKGHVEAMRVVPLTDDLLGPLRGLLFPVLGAVLIVLIIACVNVANLLLARAITRQNEMATRVAVGASRGHIARQIAAESLGFALPAALLGIVFAHYAIAGYVALAPPGLHRIDEIRIDLPVVLYSAGLAIFTALLTSLLPIRFARYADTARLLHAGRSPIGRSGATRNVLVALQVAGSFALIAGCGLLLRSVLAYSATDLGYRATQIIDVMGSPIDSVRYPTHERQVAFLAAAANGLANVPGVSAVAYGTTIPLVSNGGDRVVRIGGSAAMVDADLDYVGPAYFASLGVAPVTGREFTARDARGALPVVVVNDEFVRHFIPDGHATGKRVTFALSKGESMTIVGVVKNVRLRGVSQPVAPTMYAPVAQMPISLAGFRPMLFVRTTLAPSTMRGQLVAAWRGIDPTDSAPSVRAVVDRVAAEAGPTRAYAFILGALAIVAFILALSGTAGVVAYGVARRRSELGLRMALGARASGIVAMLLRGVCAVTCAGMLAGLALAAILGSVLAPQLYRVTPFDPVTYIVVASALLLATVAASLVPALRAMSIAPVVAIRYE